MKSRLSLMVVFAAFASTTVLGQIAVQMREQTGANGSITGDFTVQPPPILPAAITGAPYSADQVSEHTQTLADGTHITQSQRVEHLYRDSAGRTRTERPIFGGPNAPEDLPLMIEILDPVARLEYILDTEKHIAHRYTVQPQTPSRALPASAPSGVIGAARNRTAVSTGAAVVGGLGAATTTVGAVPLMHLQNTSETLGTQVLEG